MSPLEEPPPVGSEWNSLCGPKALFSQGFHSRQRTSVGVNLKLLHFSAKILFLLGQLVCHVCGLGLGVPGAVFLQ